MAGYKWVNTSWAYDLIVYALSRFTGFFGLSIAGAAVSTLTFYLAVKSAKTSLWQTSALALFYFWLMKGVVWEGLRSQMLGLLFLSVLMNVLSSSNIPKKIIFFLLLLFFFWANIHGSFVLGLFILGVAVLVKFLIRELHSGRSILAASFLPSVVATLFNPFTYQNYIEIFRHFNNPLLKNIVEWMPVKFSFSSVEYYFFLAYIVLLAIGFQKRNDFRDSAHFVISILFGVFAFTARHNWAIFVVVTLPFATLTLKEFSRTIGGIKREIALVSRTGVVALLFFALLIRLPKSHVWSYGFEDYCAFSSSCSEQLIQYLLKNPPVGHGLNKFSWGSYFIGRGVNVPVFIDGRMAIWSRDGFIPVTEYKRVYLLGDVKKFNDYHFDWVIAGHDFLLSEKMKSSTDMEEWAVAYSDSEATYFVRKQAR